MRVGEVDAAIHQQAKAARTEAIVEAQEQVPAQLIHRELQNQLWAAGRLSGLGAKVARHTSNEKTPGSVETSSGVPF